MICPQCSRDVAVLTIHQNYGCPAVPKRGVAPFPFRLGGYGAIVADPPWRFGDLGSRIATPYESMSDAEILALPVDHLAGEHSHLYCWTTDAHLALALECVKRWGFRFIQTIVWVKVRKDGTDLRISAGHYLRHAHELCLFGARDQVGLVHDVPSVFFAERSDHSRKPPEIHRIAERLSPGPRIELFARRSIDGWVCWGDQAPEVST